MAYHLAKAIYMWATSKEEYSILLLGLDNAGKTTLLNTIKQLYSAPNPTAVSPATNGDDPSSSLQYPLLNKTAPTPTVGQNVATISLNEMYLRIWDVGGQSTLRQHLWTSYYDVCHAIVFVVDSCDVGGGGDVQGNGDGDGGIGGSSSNSNKRASGRVGSGMHSASSNNNDEEAGSAFDTSASTDGRLEECRRTLEAVLSHPSTASVPLLVLANKQDREDCVETVRIKEGLVRKVFEQSEGKVRDSRVLPVSALRGDGVVEAVEWVRTRVTWNRSLREPVMR